MTVQVGKLTVRTPRRGAGRDAGFRVHADRSCAHSTCTPQACPVAPCSSCAGWSLGPASAPGGPGPPALSSAGMRPPGGLPVPASAKAVLFDDEVELLTCFTADLVRDVASRRWYWRPIGSRLEAGRGRGADRSLGCGMCAGCRAASPALQARCLQRRNPPVSAAGGPGVAGAAGGLRHRRTTSHAGTSPPASNPWYAGTGQPSGPPVAASPPPDPPGRVSFRPPPSTRTPRRSWGWRCRCTTLPPSCADPPTSSAWRTGGQPLAAPTGGTPRRQAARCLRLSAHPLEAAPAEDGPREPAGSPRLLARLRHWPADIPHRRVRFARRRRPNRCRSLTQRPAKSRWPCRPVRRPLQGLTTLG